jgi:sulfite reductase (NADPH) hemoprotein beta-component
MSTKKSNRPMSSQNKPSPVEAIKANSRGLRGTIVESLSNGLSGSIAEDDQAIIKFHGMYQQDDRDRRDERAEKMLERLYSFMIRLRLPGGVLSPEQWIALHHIAGEHATGVIKITTRQTVQLHGLLKSRIKPTIQAFNRAALDSIATCGDINRNVTCTANPAQSPAHAEVFAYADKISELLKPKTRAYYEIWLDEEKIAERSEEDPLYQDRYLPRKFKIGIAIPPNNDIDVLTNDIGLIAIVNNGKLFGFNIAIGGGLSTTHGNPNTYARLATVIGFTDTEEKTLRAIYEVLTVQRDFGDRSDRKRARLKYTVDKYGADWFREQIEQRSGFRLEPARAFTFSERKDYYGWRQDGSGHWHFTLFVENGRVVDEHGYMLKSGLLSIAQTGKAAFHFTGNQNLMLANVREADKETIDELLWHSGIAQATYNASGIRRNAMACVALPTCPLALAEGQRYLPELIDKIEPMLDRHSLSKEEIIIRMTGCPNGCGRPYTAEIGLIGTGPGKYNLHIGGDREGLRLNTPYRSELDEQAILAELDSLFTAYKAQRFPDETFGDFTFRTQIHHQNNPT